MQAGPGLELLFVVVDRKHFDFGNQSGIIIMLYIMYNVKVTTCSTDDNSMAAL